MRLGGTLPLVLGARIHYRIVEDRGPHGPWKVVVVAYWYALDDASGHEIVSYHWHPEGRSRVASPHLHVGPGAAPSNSVLAGKHLPTGHVRLEQVLRLVITELGVKPLRENWAEILDRNQSAQEELTN